MTVRLALVALAALGLGCREPSAGIGALGPGPEPACDSLQLRARPERTSLVWIVNDTMRRDRVGAYGGPARTPHFDRLARKNLLFARAFSAAPWTKPAIASLFTGLRPSQHRVLNASGLRTGSPGVRETDVLGDSRRTMAEVLRTADFHTAAFVSNPWMDAALGFGQGFETYDDSFARFDASGDLVTRAGLAWLEALPDDARFFLYLHYIDAHLPYGQLSVEEVSAARARLESDDRPLSSEAEGMLRRLRSREGGSLMMATGAPPSLALLELAYDRGIAEFDAALGAFLDGARALPSWGRAAVVVTSDHGEALFERGYGNHGRALYDEEVAIPLGARMPGVESDGGVVDCAVELIDLMPSFCDYLEVECPPLLAGASFLGSNGAARYLAAEGVPYEPEHRAVWNRRYKLVYEPGGPLRPDLKRDTERGRARPWSLFDLEADPAERRDLLDDGEPTPETEAVFEALREALESRPAAVPGSGETVPLDPELQRRLEALGYAGPGAE